MKNIFLNKEFDVRVFSFASCIFYFQALFFPYENRTKIPAVDFHSSLLMKPIGFSNELQVKW